MCGQDGDSAVVGLVNELADGKGLEQDTRHLVVTISRLLALLLLGSLFLFYFYFYFYFLNCHC